MNMKSSEARDLAYHSLLADADASFRERYAEAEARLREVADAR